MVSLELTCPNVRGIHTGKRTRFFRACLRMAWPASCLAVITIILLCVLVLSESPSLHRDSSTMTKPNKLLLLMYDGMRWDSVTDDLPGFSEMMKSGVHAHHLTPCYPTASIPNHFCVLTGNYPESHGMLGNDMYDVEHNETFRLNYDWPEDAHPQWWQHTEPIWATAAKQGKHVKVYHWAGCQMKMKDFQLTEDQCVHYRENITVEELRAAVNKGLTELADDELDFVAIYHDDPDEVNHHFGVKSPKAEAMIHKLDDVLLTLQQKASMLTIYDGNTRLSDKLDVMVVSDHGHINYSVGGAVNTRPIFAKYPDAKVLRTGQQLMIWPGKDADEIYNELHEMKNLSVYWRLDIPDRWHFKHAQFVSPIVAGADAGCFLQSPDLRGGKPKTSGFSKSSHGYDNNVTEMQAIFLARGPNFQKGKHMGPIENIELYQIMCSILGIQAAPNNGSWSAAESFVVNLKAPGPVPTLPVSFTSVFVTFIVAISAVLVLTAIICGVHYMKKRTHTRHYRTLPTNLENELENDELDL